MSTCIALTTALFIDHRRTTTLRTKIASHLQMTQIQQIGWFLLRLDVITVTVRVMVSGSLQLFLCRLERFHMQFKRARNRIRQRTNLLNTETYRAATTNTSQLLRNFLSTICL